MNKDIFNRLRNVTIKTGLDVSFFKNKLLNKDFLDDNSLKSIYFHVIEKCNLNCAYCDNYAPLSNSDWYISLNQFENNVRRLRELIEYIPFLSIGGGEPLLHPDLIQLCEILQKYYPNSFISILSNGVLLDSMDDTFVDSIKQLNAHLVISEYPISIDYIRIANKYNSNKVIYTRQKRDKMHNLQLSLTKKKGNNCYYNCTYAGFKNYKKTTPRCIQLDRYGNLFFCGVIQNVQLLENYFNIKFEVIKGKYGDYVNIHEIKSIEDILHGINNKIPFCDYCSDFSQKDILDWRISQYRIDEWCINENHNVFN